MIRTAELLEGCVLPGGWLVEKKIVPRPGATGGHFSTGYLVIRQADQKKGFLKAMDYSAAFQSKSPVDMLKPMTDAYTFERDICLKCRDSGITRVVHAIDHGSYTPALPGIPAAIANFFIVEYLVFERADGDIRGYLDQQERFDLTFALRALHSTAAALQQLHSAAIAHQDLKPSNVLVFTDAQSSKLGDLGRAWCRGLRAPHDDYPCAGDLGYAPPELLFEAAMDEQTKRFGYDMYLLGSLIVFLFTRVHCNGLLFQRLNASYHPQAANASFEEALPYLQAAFAEVIREFATAVPHDVQADLCEIVTQLCDPDPRRRGHPSSPQGNRFCLQRYVTRLDLLRFRTETRFRVGA